MDKIKFKKLKVTEIKNGNIFHIFKNSKSIKKINEIYCSQIKFGKIKAWKKHHKTNLKLVVPYGKVKFVILNKKKFYSIVIGEKNFGLITIPSGCWYGFKGVNQSKSLIVSFIDHKFSEKEIERKKLKSIKYTW